MIIANWALRASLAIYASCWLTSASGIINNQEIMLFLADFVLQKQQEDTSLFLGHGIKAHIPWPLCQSNPWNCIIQ